MSEPMHETLPTRPPGMPETDLDLWSDEVLSDPYPAYGQLRDIGPVVWLSRYGISAFPPEWILNNTLHGLSRLPVRAVPA